MPGPPADPATRSGSFHSETIRAWQSGRRQLEPPLASSIEEEDERDERWVDGRVAVEAHPLCPVLLDAGGAGAAPILVRRRERVRDRGLDPNLMSLLYIVRGP